MNRFFTRFLKIGSGSLLRVSTCQFRARLFTLPVVIGHKPIKAILEEKRNDMINAGLVHFWNDERGFGFIRRKDGGADLFFHHSELPRTKGRQTIAVDTLVKFELGVFRGQPCARNVQPLVAVEPEAL